MTDHICIFKRSLWVTNGEKNRVRWGGSCDQTGYSNSVRDVGRLEKGRGNSDEKGWIRCSIYAGIIRKLKKRRG